MVDTSERAEIKNCPNAQDCIMEMGSVLAQLPAQGHAEKGPLNGVV